MEATAGWTSSAGGLSILRLVAVEEAGLLDGEAWLLLVQEVDNGLVLLLDNLNLAPEQ